ncbi:MAG TPA: squalene synthase HpnC [Pirellulales bacterium]|nr:squalene synthase HpnC [Pirellulales bacterium]
MTRAAFAAELAAFGPEARPSPHPSLAAARDYCRRLARAHDENFAVASWLLPRALRPHFYHVYAYCRWSDDLADETGDPRASLALLDWWQEQLDDCYAGRASHPVFIALGETIREFDIPRQPLADLLSAFRQDQYVARYETFDDLLDYCRRSANPVGRIVLYLGRSHDERRGRLSDSICTGLQLANFWQDVANDWDRGRIYLPLADCRRFGYDEDSFASRRATTAFRKLLAFEVERAERWLRDGLPLADELPRALAGDIWLIAQGGLKILQKIRAVDFDVWTRRPRVSRADQAQLLAGYLVRRLVPRRPARQSREGRP